MVSNNAFFWLFYRFLTIFWWLFFLNCEIFHRISIQIWKADRLVFLNQHLDCFKKKRFSRHPRVKLSFGRIYAQFFKYSCTRKLWIGGSNFFFKWKLFNRASIYAQTLMCMLGMFSAKKFLVFEVWLFHKIWPFSHVLNP